MIQIQTNNCSAHKDYDALFANISNPSVNPLSCPVCILKTQLKDSFIYIKEVIKSGDNYPIQNWPLGIEQNTLNFLEEQQDVCKIQEIKDNIRKFYKDIQSQILKILEQSEIEQIHILNQMYNEKIDIMEFYNKCFKRQELKSLFRNINEFDQQKYSALLNEIELTRKQNLDELNKKINQNKQLENQIQFDQSAQINTIVTKLLSHIHFFRKPQQDKQNSSNQDILIQTDTPINTSNISQLADLIIYNLDRFKDVKQTILQNLHILEELSQHQSSKSHQYIQKNESTNNNMLFKLNLLKLNWKDSQKYLLTNDQQQNWSITNNGYDISGFAYSENILEMNKSYTVRFRFNYPLYKCDIVGIGILKSQKEYSDIDENQLLSNSACGNKQQLLKGNFFINVQNKELINEIEMRIRLDKGIIQFSDYPHYQNVLQNKQPLDLNYKYRIGVGLSGKLTKEIKITYYEESQHWNSLNI